jgi:hypothetical protein
MVTLPSNAASIKQRGLDQTTRLRLSNKASIKQRGFGQRGLDQGGFDQTTQQLCLPL